jgi:hypothetical protein
MVEVNGNFEIVYWIEKKPIQEFSNIELIDELLRRGYSVTVTKKKPDPKMDKYLQKEEEKIKIEGAIYADFRS